MPVPAFRPRMVCASCGIVGADLRPNWLEREERITDRRAVALMAKRSRSSSARLPTCWRSGPSCAAPPSPTKPRFQAGKGFFQSEIWQAQNVEGCCNLDTISNFAFRGNRLRSAWAANCIRQ
jgi:hypothetical protein